MRRLLLSTSFSNLTEVFEQVGIDESLSDVAHFDVGPNGFFHVGMIGFPISLSHFFVELVVPWTDDAKAYALPNEGASPMGALRDHWILFKKLIVGKY